MIRIVLTIVALALALAAEPVLAQSKCTSAQWKTATKLAADLGKCESKGAKKGLEADPACVAKGVGKFDKGMAKATNKGDCIVEVDDAAVQTLSEELVEDLRRRLDPQPATCCALFSSCTMFTDATACTDAGGTPGAAGTGCDDTGCVDPPAVAAPACCQDFDIGEPGTLCTLGSFAAGECTAAGGTFTANAFCTVNGFCEAVAP